MKTIANAALASLVLLASAPALAQGPGCRVEPFRGATTAAGAEATMHVRNTGEACLLRSYGMPAERMHPSTSGRITRAPNHGKVTFTAPDVSYIPEPGFAGEDEFTFEARATGAANQNVVLFVRVKVLVSKP